MKRIGVAGYITKYNGDLLLGRRGKDPNRGLYVLPGGGVEEGETLEQAFAREIQEETGYKVYENPNRWDTVNLIELDDRLIIVAKAQVIDHHDMPKAGGDLYDVAWFHWHSVPFDHLSTVVKDVILSIKRAEEMARAASYYDPYDNSKTSPGW